MIVLFDTNILIQREDNNILSENLINLLNMMGELKYIAYVHELSFSDVNNDKDKQRKEINISKLKAYPRIENYPKYQDDTEFKSVVGIPKKINDEIDNHLIYAVCKNATDYLITEDIGILNKAERLNIGNRILNINEAIVLFKSLLPNFKINILPFFREEKGSNLDLADSIFDSLKEEYEGFESWWAKSASKRNAYVYVDDSREKDKIKAILVPKIEKKMEFTECLPALNPDIMLKICLFKVADHAKGLRLGERLLSMAFEVAEKNKIDEIYLTHFTKPNDSLVKLIEEYGFYKYGEKQDGEDIFVKKIATKLKTIINNKQDALEFNRKFFPSFYDGNLISKHIVPINPPFHDKLFPDCKNHITQLKLFFDGHQTPEGNSIKKAYICNAPTRKIKEGDILLFYRTVDRQAITTLGTVEQVCYNLLDTQEILKLVAKRTVYDLEEIEHKVNSKSPVLVILFKQNFHLKDVFSYRELQDNNIVSGPIQTITEIDDNGYKKITKGKINERFIINKT